MSSFQLVKCAEKLSKLNLRNSKIILTSVRNHWNKDFKPAPYPVTENERLAAAKRYNIHPAEYVPYDDDGTGYGDYPKIKALSGDARDPFYPWDNPALKRNFNEVLHVEFDLIREDRYDVNAKYFPSCVVQYLQFLGVMSGFFFLYWIAEYAKGFHAISAKQYPGEGKKHYLFE